ncbi:MAG: META domain-containing protein, partial [Desulfuromonadales bacterium]
LFLLLHGCAQKPVIPLEEIPDRVWLPVSNENHVMDGFFTGADGQLLLVNNLHHDGVSWELKDDHLLLWFRTENQSALQSLAYYPLLLEGKLFLARAVSQESPAYAADSIQEPLSNVHYFPTYLGEPLSVSPDSPDHAAYLQIDTGDRTLRGFAGVNNFHGSYQRTGAAGFNLGPIATTMMTGPGMDYERKFMRCLNQSDAILTVSKRLLFYQGSRLICSFTAD